ncbi:single-stranded DNA binding protein (Ssb) [Ligilactobacillus saerimneri DSM 16049]|nr:single-stranded DNA binding protein (Ssb) [Ligilactobacillus saerimneri DSM 16049]
MTRDAELRYTQSGVAVASFTVAVDRQFRTQAGEREADFINCVIWRKSAENFVNFTHKGSMVGIDGRLQTRNYENQQGQRVYVTEVVVDSFALMESRSQSEQYRQTHGGNGMGQGGAPNNGFTSGNNGYAGGNNAPAGGYSNPSQGYSNNAAPMSGNTGNQNQDLNQDPFSDDQNGKVISDDDLPF